MKKFEPAAVSLGLGLTILYLSVHAMTGSQGLIAYLGLQEREHALEGERAALSAEQAALEARAARLRASSLDLDYLDERARYLLGAGRAGEETFLLDAR